jgi:hypothetical protein
MFHEPSASYAARVSYVIGGFIRAPPFGNLLMRMMLTQMLVQIPLIFVAAAVWGARVRWSARAHWRAWNVQGASGLLTAALVSAFWMTPIALDHAASDWSWEALATRGSGAARGLSGAWAERRNIPR